MLTLKEALVKDGQLDPAKAGRGRPAAWMIEAAEKLVAQGWQIKGFTSNKPADSTEPVKVVKEKRRDPGAVVDIPDETRSEFLWRAFAENKEIGMRQVCNNCGASLTYCPCPVPRVWVDYDRQANVSFKPRKA